jgi:hypothetical protein
MISNYKSNSLLSFVENFFQSNVHRSIKKGKEMERGQRLKDRRFYILFEL